jgi:hypothetical protein
VIRVAHYAVQAGVAQDVTASPDGEVVELHLEPFEENPQAESVFLADDLDLDVPLYLDVGFCPAASRYRQGRRNPRTKGSRSMGLSTAWSPPVSSCTAPSPTAALAPSPL